MAENKINDKIFDNHKLISKVDNIIYMLVYL